MLSILLLPRASVAGESTLAAVQNTLEFFGCEVRAEQLLVRARPVARTEPVPTDVVAGRITPGTPDVHRGGGVEMARIVRTGPGSFAFSFDVLDPGTIYRVGVKLVGQAANRCPRFAWYTDHEALIADGSDPVHIRGFALRSELQMFRVDRGRAQGVWVGRDNIDFSDPSAATREFRWQSTLPGVTGGVLQVSAVPFPKPSDTIRPFDPCNAQGVIHARSFQAVAGEWTNAATINFHELLNDGVRAGSVDSATFTSLQLGMPLYVRVVPTIAGRMLCDSSEGGAPSEAVIAKVNQDLLGPHPPGPAVTVESVFYQSPDINPKHPKWGKPERCYRVIKTHAPVFDPGKYVVMFGYQTVWDFYLAAKGLDGTVGQTFCITESSGDDGWFESLTSSVTSFVGEIVDGIEQLVDFAAKTWDDIKTKAVVAVADGLNTIGVVDCDATCQAGLQLALEVALASMGIPPSLPNFEELKQQGLDYLAAQAAEATGVPGPIAQIIVNKGAQFVQEEVDSMQRNYSVPGLPKWLAADILFEPAFLTLRLWGTGQPLATKPLLIRNSDPIFAFANLVLPKRLPAPDEPPLSIPWVLLPNLNNVTEPPPGHTEYGKAVWFKDHWYKERFVNGCYALVITALAPGDVISLFQATFRPDVLPIEGCTK